MKKETANDHVHTLLVFGEICTKSNEKINLSKFLHKANTHIHLNLATGQNETQILSLDILTFPHRTVDATQ